VLEGQNVNALLIYVLHANHWNIQIFVKLAIISLIIQITNFALDVILTNKEGNIAIIAILGNVKNANGVDLWKFIYSKEKLIIKL